MAFYETRREGVVFTRSDRITAPHGFTTRIGGVSRGIYESLNLRIQSDDGRDCLRENFRRAMSALEMPLERLVRSNQVHRDGVLVCDETTPLELFAEIPYEADALITNVPGLPLMIFIADCIPLLLYDVRGAAGAVHCGWRSTVMDIPGKAVRLMGASYGTDPGDIRAAVGPGISLCCFETGEDVAEGVRNVLGTDEFVYPKENGKFQVDLKGVVKELLIRAGVPSENIDISPECTVCLHDKYWSHRFTKGQRGLQSAVIMLDRI